MDALQPFPPPTPGQPPKTELIAPAGDRDCASAAVENGADAVYFGLSAGFNARARAANFAPDQVSELMGYLHRRGVKGYVTLNTLVFPSELPDLEQTVRLVADGGVDAVLVQDLGLARLIRVVCPEMPLHASTQMTLTSAENLRVAESLGIARVVLPRELSLAEIAAIRGETKVELEAFVHGALCVAYSGQCLTSESLGGRSANRGQCAQACRMPYRLICDDRELDLGDRKYLLSPQDLAAYDLLPQLLAAGVSAFKIEGRLKAAEYVANITHQYRLAIDAALAGRPVQFTPQQVEDMEVSFSRGFSHGWLEGCDPRKLVPGLNSAKRGVLLGEVTSLARGRIRVELASAVKRGDGVVFEGDRITNAEQGGRVYEVFQDGRSLQEPVGAGSVELAFRHGSIDTSRLWVGQKAWKTDDPELNRRLRKTFSGSRPHRRMPLDLTVEAAVGRPLSVSARTENGIRVQLHSSAPLQAAIKHAISADVLIEQLGRLGGSAYQLRHLEARIDGRPMVPLSVLGKLRHEMLDQLDAAASRGPVCPLAAEPVLPRLLAGITEENYACDPHARRGSPDPSARRGSPDPSARRGSPDPSARRGSPDPAETSNSQVPVQGRPSVEEVARSGDRPQREGDRTQREGDRTQREVEGTQREPQLCVLCRSLEQIEAALACGASWVAADFADMRQYASAVEAAHAAGAGILLATPRIQKPGETGVFRAIQRHRPDGVLARNLAGLAYFAAQGLTVVADFSLNTANPLTAEWLRQQGAVRVTAAYDLNRDQLLDLAAAVPPHWLEVVVHQHMPMFHMEHCVFCAALSPGANRSDCGRPCDRHTVRLADRIGMEHPLAADVGCRNTLFNAVPQSGAEIVPLLLARGIRHFRVELLNQTGGETRQTIQLYRDLLAGHIGARAVWSRLQAANRVGVTRGTLEDRRNPDALL